MGTEKNTWQLDPGHLVTGKHLDAARLEVQREVCPGGEPPQLTVTEDCACLPELLILSQRKHRSVTRVGVATSAVLQKADTANGD